MFKAITRVAATAVIATGVSMGGAAIASAAPCPAGYMCGWGDRDYLTSGSQAANVKAYECQYDLAFLNYSGTTRRSQDDITSVYNNGNSNNGYYYTAAGYGGTPMLVSRGTGKPELNVSNSGMNDKISSFKFTSASNTCH
ncbi:peptidase inhibitor family I36 protein [Knoellia sp. CPCC 206453]|uniref:peptidase inhibitor family I36 protein n=1 Tax=Knoellia pratensis TaxID=3404796 RepID=UPI0036239971